MLLEAVNSYSSRPISVDVAYNVKRVWTESSAITVSKILKYDFEDAIVCSNNLIFFNKNDNWTISCSKSLCILNVDVNAGTDEIYEKILLVILTQMRDWYGITPNGSIAHYISLKCLESFFSLYKEFQEAKVIWNS